MLILWSLIHLTEWIQISSKFVFDCIIMHFNIPILKLISDAFLVAFHITCWSNSDTMRKFTQIGMLVLTLAI